MTGRPWPYDGPIGRARLTGNLGVEEPPRPGSCICGKNCAPCEECGRPPELHDKSEGTCEPPAWASAVMFSGQSDAGPPA